MTTLKAAGISGVNWSIHRPTYIFHFDIFHKTHINVFPVRILVGEHEVTQSIKDYAIMNGMDMRIWKMDDCKDMPEEDRYRIDWNRI